MKRLFTVPGLAIFLVCATLSACAESGPLEPPEAPPAPPPVVPPVVPPPVVPPPPPRITVDSVYVANADGSGVTALALGSAPAWSSDGKQLAFWRAGQIHIMLADGSNARVLTTDGGWPNWAPDGKRIVFVSSEGITVINIDGSGREILVRHDFRQDTYAAGDMGVGGPSWSPDGQRIAFHHSGDGDTAVGQIYVMSAPGSSPVRLSRDENFRCAEGDPSWSPDGSRIVFRSYCYGIATVDGNGHGLHTVVRNSPAAHFVTKPSWSPDGHSISFTVGHFPDASIWVTDLSGSASRLLIRNGFDATWSPQRTRIAFVRTS